MRHSSKSSTTTRSEGFADALLVGDADGEVEGPVQVPVDGSDEGPVEGALLRLVGLLEEEEGSKA